MNKYHSFYSSGGGSISLVDAKSESFFTFVDERSSRLAGVFFIAGGSSATTTRLSSLRVHFSVDDVDKSFSDLIFVFVGEDMGEVFCRLLVIRIEDFSQRQKMWMRMRMRVRRWAWRMYIVWCSWI